MFAKYISEKATAYIQLRRSLGYAFNVQAATLQSFVEFVKRRRLPGPLTSTLALSFVLSRDVTPMIRARRYAVLVHFAEYLAVFNARAPALDPDVLPRPRATPPPRILTDVELSRLLAAAKSIRSHTLHRATLHTLIGLLASSGLRSGEALRLDCSHVDLTTGVLQVRKTKFRKDRLVPVHATTRARLQDYAAVRERTAAQRASPAFFVGRKGRRLSVSSLGRLFHEARRKAGLVSVQPRVLRLHDLRHRFAIKRIAQWYREGVDVQTQLPALASYLGHARFSDTAYYVTAAPELLALVAARVFRSGGNAQ